MESRPEVELSVIQHFCPREEVPIQAVLVNKENDQNDNLHRRDGDLENTTKRNWQFWCQRKKIYKQDTNIQTFS